MSVEIGPKRLAPGTIVRHRSGTEVVLARRKEDDSGWWNTNGSGLADHVFQGGGWTVVEEVTRPAPHSLNHARKCLFCQQYGTAEGERCSVRSELQQWGFDV